jgi:lipopolysaccharide/colanic/teichoic acid biosynthesis glycosyltransferase
MNKPESSIPPTYAGDPLPSRGSIHDTEDPAESSSRAALYLAWSNAGEIADSQDAPHRIPVPSTSGRRRDRGLWLLRDTLIRQEAWASLSAVLVAFPLSNQLSLRRGYTIAKRSLDVVASLSLLVLLAPLFLLVATLIRLDSVGPAFFRQRRVGADGAEFLLWKFRSMHSEAPPYARSPTSDQDPRLTRVGRLIRRVSVDELPQLLNVLAGDMSLVGPRPEMPFIVDGYTPFERARLAVKPGITGLWQVSPGRALPIHENLQYDLHYIQHQNLILDTAILLRTVAAIIHGVGAI